MTVIDGASDLPRTSNTSCERQIKLAVKSCIKISLKYLYYCKSILAYEIEHKRHIPTFNPDYICSNVYAF